MSRPDDSYARALELAFGFLAARPRSEHEMRERLARAVVGGPVIEQVLDRLRELRLVDDTAFAAFWLTQRQGARARGAALLKHELWQKGVSRDVATEALDRADVGAEAAYQAGLRKARQLHGADPGDFRRQLGSYLARRGFTWEAITLAVKRLWSERSSV